MGRTSRPFASASVFSDAFSESACGTKPAPATSVPVVLMKSLRSIILSVFLVFTDISVRVNRLRLSRKATAQDRPVKLILWPAALWGRLPMHADGFRTKLRMMIAPRPAAVADSASCSTHPYRRRSMNRQDPARHYLRRAPAFHSLVSAAGVEQIAPASLLAVRA